MASIAMTSEVTYLIYLNSVKFYVVATDRVARSWGVWYTVVKHTCFEVCKTSVHILSIPFTYLVASGHLLSFSVPVSLAIKCEKIPTLSGHCED